MSSGFHEAGVCHLLGISQCNVEVEKGPHVGAGSAGQLYEVEKGPHVGIWSAGLLSPAARIPSWYNIFCGGHQTTAQPVFFASSARSLLLSVSNLSSLVLTR